jgi:hypothetical protein
MWHALGGICDAAGFLLLAQQIHVIWRLTERYGITLLDTGMLSGVVLVVLVRMIIFHLFQRAFGIGDTIKTVYQQKGKIFRAGLLFSTVKLSDESYGIIWNLESSLDRGEKIRDEMKLQIWSIPSPTIINYIDTLLVIVAIIPPIFSSNLSQLAVMGSAALSMIVVLLLGLSAQIGLLRYCVSKSELQFDLTQIRPLYRGIFCTILRSGDDGVHFRFNAAGRVQLASDCYFGPYL